MKKIRVLEVLPCLTQTNGIATYISNYYTFANNKQNFDVDFLVFAKSACDKHDDILKSGGKIIKLYLSKNIFAYLKKLNQLFEKNNYDIIHCHAPNYGALIMPIAKKYHVKVRIVHNHVNRSGETPLKRLRNYLMSLVCVKYSNYYFACSDLAAKMLYKSKNYYILNNAIDIDKFKYSEAVRRRIRTHLKIDNKFVIGEFGRLCNQKNQMFALEIFKAYLNINHNAILILAGDGPLEQTLKKKVENLNLKNNVIFLGSVKNISDYYNALDFFILPSTYEGLGIVLIEAQANGLYCLASDKVIPQQAKVSDSLEFVSLNESPKDWANKITTKKRKNNLNEINKHGFNIRKESNKLFELYLQFYNKEGN